jgi:membrane associated rhomboid family serine protease
MQEPQQQREPFLNIPPLTGVLVSLLIMAHIYVVAKPFPIERYLVDTFSFVPNLFWQDPLMEMYRLFTYNFLHFGLLHLTVNGFGLLAFGSGIEKIYGRLWMAVILTVGTCAGALGHVLLYHQSDIPLGGISAGVSALLGALIYRINRKKSLFSGIFAFICVNAIVGLMGLPDQPGLAIAWEAHIFGFLTGILAAKIAEGTAKHDHSSNNT